MRERSQGVHEAPQEAFFLSDKELLGEEKLEDFGDAGAGCPRDIHLCKDRQLGDRQVDLEAGDPPKMQPNVHLGNQVKYYRRSVS